MKKLTKQEQKGTQFQTTLLKNVEQLKWDHCVRSGIRPDRKYLLALDDETALIKAQENNMKKLTRQEPTRYKMSRFEDEELKPTEPEMYTKSGDSIHSEEDVNKLVTTNKIEISNKLVDDNDSTSSAKNAQHFSGGCLHTAQCLYRMRDIQSKEKVVK